MTDAAKAVRPAGGAEPGRLEPGRSSGSEGKPGPRRIGKARDGGKGLSEHTQMRIGSELRSLYDSVLQQPVPDRFRDLIDRLGSENPKTP